MIKNTAVILGYDRQCMPVCIDFRESPHILIAGATGSGKSVMMHSIACGLISSNTPETAQFLMIDPKRVEMFDYNRSPLLFGGKVYEDLEESIKVLEAVNDEMESRYFQLKYMNARSVEDIPKNGTMPRIYIFIDELSFLMLKDKKKIEKLLSSIGMMGRAAGIHLILCTQHPDRKTITGTIQANITTVVALATRTAVDSRMIAGSSICTTLKGKGDAVLIDGLEEIRFQGKFTSRFEVAETINAAIIAGRAPVPEHNKNIINRWN